MDRRRTVRLLIFGAVLASLGAAPVAAVPITATVGDDSLTTSSNVTLRVATFNILYGGDELDLTTPRSHWCVRPSGCAASIEQVVAAVRASGADTVGIQEGTGNGCRIADLLGWHCNGRLQVISRYPLIDPPGADGLYVYNEVAPGRVVAIANVHLTSDPYGPYFPREGWTARGDPRPGANAAPPRGRAPCRGIAWPGGLRHSGDHDRRLQLPVAPRLDECGVGGPTGGGSLPDRLARRPGAGRRGLQ